jgi:hypothetical protein
MVYMLLPLAHQQYVMCYAGFLHQQYALCVASVLTITNMFYVLLPF